jgi:hypothetical protein
VWRHDNKALLVSLAKPIETDGYFVQLGGAKRWHAKYQGIAFGHFLPQAFRCRRCRRQRFNLLYGDPCVAFLKALYHRADIGILEAENDHWLVVLWSQGRFSIQHV